MPWHKSTHNSGIYHQSFALKKGLARSLAEVSVHEILEVSISSFPTELNKSIY